MRKIILRKSLAYIALILLTLQSCKDDSFLTNPLPVQDQSFTESFDVYQEAYDKGWRAINKSTPVGRKWLDVTETPIITSPNYVAIYYPEWNQAQFTLDSNQFVNTAFPQRYWETAYSSQRASNGYVATSIASAEVINLTLPNEAYTINNWLVSPEIIMQDGDKISFYTYSKGVASLQLWVNETNTLNVGDNPDNTGDFSSKLVDINPGYKDVTTDPVKAYPQDWTRFEGVIKGLKNPVRGRFAFRHFIKNAGPLPNTLTFDEIYNEIHQSVVGIDAVTYTSAPK